MTVPTEATYSVAAIAAATTSLLDLIDAGAGAGQINIYDEDDELLAVIPLAIPAGNVSGTSGTLTLTTPVSDPAANMSGVAAYGVLEDYNHTAILSLPCQAGASAVSGYLVLSSLDIAVDAVVTLTAATIG